MLVKSKDPEELLKILQKHHNMMDTINISTAAVAIARIISRIRTPTKMKQQQVIDNIFEFLCNMIIKQVGSMNSQSVSNCAWSLAKYIGLYSDSKQKKQYVFLDAFRVLCERALVVVKYMNSQESINWLWAMAKFGLKNNQYMKLAIEQAINTTKNNFKEQAVSNVLWAIATLQYQDIKAVQYFVMLFKNCFNKMSGQGITNSLWSLQQLRYYDAEILQKIENTINFTNLHFNSQDLANMALAFADFNLRNKELTLGNLVAKFMAQSKYNLQEYSNFIYAMAVMECPINLAQEVVDKMMTNTQYNMLLDKDLTQIRQAQLCYESVNQELLVPYDLQEKSKTSLQEIRKSQSNIKNDTIDKIFTQIQSFYKQAQQRIITHDDQIDINIAIEQNSQKVAVMVLVKQDYFANLPDVIIGRVQRKAYFLSRIGWKVIIVSGIKWKDQSYQKQILHEIAFILK